jgi:hypothetical protein
MAQKYVNGDIVDDRDDAVYRESLAIPARKDDRPEPAVSVPTYEPANWEPFMRKDTTNNNDNG